ncbi:MAG: hypothetical protein HKN37_05420 [Rhodothermales bacterium]|nr:hypothetical protein [Rhodothermales bacterium]
MEYDHRNLDLSGARPRRRRRTSIGLVVALIAAVLTFSVAPAGAGAGAPSAEGIQPAEVNLGGQNNDCSANISGRLPSAATYDFRISNPQDGQTYNGPGGVSFTLTVSGNDKNLDYVLTGPAVVFDVIIKGGQKSLHYDYDGNGGPGGATADQDLHAPTKGNGSNLYSISHVSFCYKDAVPVSGFVYVDEDQSGTKNGNEGADAPRVITAYVGAPVVGAPVVAASTTSATDGTYTMYLEAGNDYTICEEDIPDFVQTAPANTDCTTSGSEDGGHAVPNLQLPVGGLDFGNAPQICGQVLSVDGVVFDGNFELFSQGNGEVGCDDKIGTLFESTEEGVKQLNLPLVGTGEIAGIGVITKDFGAPPFVPLTYAQSTTDGFEVLPWCGLRAKVGNDGNQFNPYLADDSMYPSLDGVTDPDSGDPSVSCKVSEDEDVEGTQITVVLIQDDPFWQ